MTRLKRGNQRFVPISLFVANRFNIRPGILCDSRLVENRRTGEKKINNPRHDQWDFRDRKYFQRKHASLSLRV